LNPWLGCDADFQSARECHHTLDPDWRRAFPFAAIGVTYAYINSSYVTGQDVILEQPVPFSHKHHARELGIGCLYCHTGVGTSAFAGLPATHICMTCHSQIWTNAALLAPVRESGSVSALYAALHFW
jgi:hypothetical protein